MADGKQRAAQDQAADTVRAEAEERAHERVSPDAVLEAVAAVEVYIEAFVAGAKFAMGRLGASR